MQWVVLVKSKMLGGGGVGTGWVGVGEGTPWYPVVKNLPYNARDGSSVPELRSHMLGSN